MLAAVRPRSARGAYIEMSPNVPKCPTRKRSLPPQGPVFSPGRFFQAIKAPRARASGPSSLVFAVIVSPYWSARQKVATPEPAVGRTLIETRKSGLVVSRWRAWVVPKWGDDSTEGWQGVVEPSPDRMALCDSNPLDHHRHRVAAAEAEASDGSEASRETVTAAGIALSFRAAGGHN
jgi:hypothetical protein